MDIKPVNGLELLAAVIRPRTQKQFADEVECSESHLCLVLKGKRGVSLGLAKRISEATGGLIPVDALPHKATAE